MAQDLRQYGTNFNEDDTMALLMALKLNINRDLNVATLATVSSINDDKIVCKPFPLLNKETEKLIYCEKLKNLELTKNDIVVVLFTDRNFIQCLKQLRNNQKQTTISDNSELHSDKYGIIIGIL